MGFYITCPVTGTATALATDMPTATVTTTTSKIKTMGDNTAASACNLTLVNSNFDNLENGTEVAEITTDDGYKVIAKIVDNNVVFSKYNSENEIISSEKIQLSFSKHISSPLVKVKIIALVRSMSYSRSDFM